MATVVPQLSLTAPIAENQSDKLISLLKFLMFNPGWISSWYDNELLSMRKSMAEYTEDRKSLVPALSRMLNEAIHNYYPSYNCHIEVIPDSDPNVYSMDISIVDAIGKPVIQFDRIKKDESGLFVIK